VNDDINLAKTIEESHVSDCCHNWPPDTSDWPTALPKEEIISVLKNLLISVQNVEGDS